MGIDGGIMRDDYATPASLVVIFNNSMIFLVIK